MHQDIPAVSQVAEWYRICLPLQEMQETQVQSLSQEDSLEEEMATHSLGVTKGQIQLSDWAHARIPAAIPVGTQTDWESQERPLKKATSL